MSKSASPAPSSVPVASAPRPAAPGQPTQSVSPARQANANRVVLEFVKPDARTVCVAGSFNNWKPEQTPLTAAGNGRWVGSLAVGPGRHEYLFVVDGQWLPDPNAPEAVANPFGGKNSVLLVSE